MRRLSMAAFLMLITVPLGAVECRDIRLDGNGYTICEADAAHEDIRLFLDDPDTGAALGGFGKVDARLAREGSHLAFAMNAGMYHPDRRPVGLYVEDGETLAPVVSRKGPGNFGMVPNGVFCIREGRADVMETRRFLAERPNCRYATQSGPMLVIDRALHPRFLPDSDSRHIRNGVGTSADGQRVVFAISRRPVNFHAFARLFRDGLNLPEALYLDGNISRLYAPGWGAPMAGFRWGRSWGSSHRTIDRVWPLG